MKEFRTYLQEVEKSIPPGDMDYYQHVTKPVYNQLMDEVERRFELLGIVMKNSVTENLQALLVTGDVNINDYRSSRIKNVEPVISINETVRDVMEKQDGTIEVYLKSGKNNYLFSFICDCGYDEYMQMNNEKISAELCISGSDGEKKELIYHNNEQYKRKEKEIKELFVSNRPQSSYFEIPLCRRIMDVYSVENIIPGTEIVLRVDNLPGKIRIPVWNLLSGSSASNGSYKTSNLYPDKKVISPYGLTGEQNQYSISFENCPENMLDGVVKIKDYSCNYMFSFYDKEQKILKLYTQDKKVWEQKFFIYSIMKLSAEDESPLQNKKMYSCLNDFIKEGRIQKSITEASIYYYVNIFKNVTGLILKNIVESSDSGMTKLEFIITEERYKSMADEYKKFVTDLLNEIFVGHHFESQVIQHG